MNEGPVRLAVLGDPLAYTRSPDLHQAGCAALDVTCESRALRTSIEQLPERLMELAAEGYRGVNLTYPLKEAALDCVSRATASARRARSVNTIGFDPDGWWGTSTDGWGFLDLLVELGADPRRERIVLLGAGGAARSLATALLDAGCPAPTVSARLPEAVRDEWFEQPEVTVVGWRSEDEMEALAAATIVVNSTPLGGEEFPVPIELVGAQARVLDLVYDEQPTPWVMAARGRGLMAVDGLGLLVHQARLSLSLWLGRTVPIEPLARSVGWPR